MILYELITDYTGLINDEENMFFNQKNQSLDNEGSTLRSNQETENINNEKITFYNQ